MDIKLNIMTIIVLHLPEDVEYIATHAHSFLARENDSMKNTRVEAYYTVKLPPPWHLLYMYVYVLPRVRALTRKQQDNVY